jgi:hypothetical protein
MLKAVTSKKATSIACVEFIHWSVEMQLIDRGDFPVLDHLLWDTQIKQISSERAFLTYEKRWGYVDHSQLTAHERHLIKQLTEQVGHGVFMPAKG